MNVQIASIQNVVLNLRYLSIKRAIDILFALPVLPPLCIIVAIVALLIRLDSAGPVFIARNVWG